MASPLGPLYGIVASNLSAQNEVYSLISEDARRNVLRGLFASYYDNINREVVFDSGRYWTSQMAAIAQLFPDAKVICCVRPVAEIIDSIERLLERNALETSALFGFKADGNLVTRAEYTKSPKGIVGNALNNLKEAYYGRFSDRLLLVRYDSLTAKPLETLERIYQFIEEPIFAHDPENFEFDAELVDLRLGAKGLHTVRGPVFYREATPHLPPDLIKACNSMDFWASPVLRGRSRAQIV